MVVERIYRAALLGGVILVSACAGSPAADDADDDGDDTPVLRLATFWTSGGEQQALQSVLTAFGGNHDVTFDVLTLAQGQVDRQAQYQAGDWDIGQENAFGVAGSFAAAGGGYTALDLSSGSRLTAALAAVHSDIRSQLTVDGQLLSFPMNVHRENTLHYAKALVATPPSTLAELEGMCDDYVGGGSTGPKPLAIGRADWINRILLEALLPPHVMSGEDADPRPELTAALTLILKLYDQDCLWIAPSEHGWDEAAAAVMNGDAAMFIHGDWAKGLMVQAGSWQPGVDFDVAPAPGSEGAFYYGVDVFALNAASDELNLALDFAEAALSEPVQIAFSQLKGSTPGIVIDDPVTAIDDVSLRGSYQQLITAQSTGVLLPVPAWIANNGPLILPLIDGTQTPAQVAEAYYAVYP